MPEYLGSKDRSGSYASKSNNMRRAASFRRVRVCLLLLFFLPENADDLLDRILWLLLLWLLLCSAGPFLPQHAAQNPRHGRRGVVGVRQETLELHLPNLLKIGGELGIL